MMDMRWQKLQDWMAAVREYTPTPWERLPELELYMDQVITLMDKQLKPFTGSDDKPLTPSMINNYVKDEVLPRPEKKKYSRNHLAMLMMICILKPVLSLPEIHEIISNLLAEHKVEELYPVFAEKQQSTIQEVAQRMEEMAGCDRQMAYQKAVGLALEAAARRAAAEQILAALAETAPESTEDGKKNKKKGEKSESETEE